MGVLKYEHFENYLELLLLELLSQKSLMSQLKDIFFQLQKRIAMIDAGSRVYNIFGGTQVKSFQ